MSEESPPYLTVGLLDLWDAVSVDHRVDCRVGVRQEDTWKRIYKVVFIVLSCDCRD